MPNPAPPFWELKPLSALAPEEWEGLCDGCGKCCLLRLEDEDTAEIHYTNVVCGYYDQDAGLCTDYPNRSRNRPDCVTLTPAVLSGEVHWLPASCAYRRLAEGAPLPPWHPLLSGDPESPLWTGHSIRGRAVPEAEADDLEHHLTDWGFEP